MRGSSGFGRAYEAADNRANRSDWLKDVETVNAWVRAQPSADPRRIVVSGQSHVGYPTLIALPLVAASEGHTVDRRETEIELLTRTATFLEDALELPRQRSVNV